MLSHWYSVTRHTKVAGTTVTKGGVAVVSSDQGSFVAFAFGLPDGSDWLRDIWR